MWSSILIYGWMLEDCEHFFPKKYSGLSLWFSAGYGSSTTFVGVWQAILFCRRPFRVLDLILAYNPLFCLLLVFSLLVTSFTSGSAAVQHPGFRWSKFCCIVYCEWALVSTEFYYCFLLYFHALPSFDQYEALSSFVFFCSSCPSSGRCTRATTVQTFHLPCCVSGKEIIVLHFCPCCWLRVLIAPRFMHAMILEGSIIPDIVVVVAEGQFQLGSSFTLLLSTIGGGTNGLFMCCVLRKSSKVQCCSL